MCSGLSSKRGSSPLRTTRPDRLALLALIEQNSSPLITMVGSQPCAVNPPFHVNWRSPTLFSEASATVVFSASLIPKIPKLPNEEFPSGSSATQPFRERSINRDPSFVSMGAPLGLPVGTAPFDASTSRPPQPGRSPGPHRRSRLVPHAWVVTEGVPRPTPAQSPPGGSVGGALPILPIKACRSGSPLIAPPTPQFPKLCPGLYLRVL